jgi:hypothetical protein
VMSGTTLRPDSLALAVCYATSMCIALLSNQAAVCARDVVGNGQRE